MTQTGGSGTLVYGASRALARLLLAPFTRTRVLGRQHLEACGNGACLLAANHISHFDPVLLGCAIDRRIDYMATAEFFSPAPYGAWMRAVGAFPVNRSGPGAQAIREAARRLRSGRLVGMFPEGGLRAGATSILEGAPGRAGLGRLASLAQSPVVPCVILGTDRLYDPHRWRPGRGRVPIWIGFGVAIAPSDWAGNNAAADDLLGERLRALYAQMKQHFALQSADLPTTPQRRKGHF
jgi:1-acyl-sn-glycerol-3-phosphate acyltransferase